MHELNVRSIDNHYRSQDNSYLQIKRTFFFMIPVGMYQIKRDLIRI